MRGMKQFRSCRLKVQSEAMKNVRGRGSRVPGPEGKTRRIDTPTFCSSPVKGEEDKQLRPGSRLTGPRRPFNVDGATRQQKRFQRCLIGLRPLPPLILSPQGREFERGNSESIPVSSQGKEPGATTSGRSGGHLGRKFPSLQNGTGVILHEPLHVLHIPVRFQNVQGFGETG